LFDLEPEPEGGDGIDNTVVIPARKSLERRSLPKSEQNLDETLTDDEEGYNSDE
jgi:hypothetical protein